MSAVRDDSKYSIISEMPAGKGFADLVFIPFRNVEAPAMVIELKRDSSAEAAIAQVKKKNYPDALKDFIGELLLVGINYQPDKKHTCIIERIPS